MWNLGEYCTTSEAILTATNKTGCSLIPGTVFCEVLEANRPGMIIDKVMKNLGNYTSVFVVVVVVVGNYSDVDRNFNKSVKRFGDSGEVSPWNKKGAQNLLDFILFFFSWWVTLRQVIINKYASEKLGYFCFLKRRNLTC